MFLRFLQFVVLIRMYDVKPYTRSCLSYYVMGVSLDVTGNEEIAPQFLSYLNNNVQLRMESVYMQRTNTGMHPLHLIIDGIPQTTHCHSDHIRIHIKGWVNQIES